MARTYAQIFVRGRCLFRQATSFPRTRLQENCKLRRRGNIQGKISEHFFKVKWRLLCLLSFKYFSQHAGSASLSYVNLVKVCQLAFTIPTSFTIFRFRFNRKHMLEEKVQHLKGNIFFNPRKTKARYKWRIRL